MYKMVEIVGISQEGYSEAVRDAINKVCQGGEAATWYEVVEQRGAIRGGQLAEFQVKLKVAVAVPEKKKNGQNPGQNEAELCPTCQEPTGSEGHLCVPKQRGDQTCDWCGSLIPDARHLCDGKVKELAYICNSCGRTAVSADHLCKPNKIIKAAGR